MAKNVILTDRNVRKRAAVDEQFERLLNALILMDEGQRNELEMIALTFAAQVDGIGLVGSLELLVKLGEWLTHQPMPKFQDQLPGAAKSSEARQQEGVL